MRDVKIVMWDGRVFIGNLTEYKGDRDFLILEDVLEDVKLGGLTSKGRMNFETAEIFSLKHGEFSLERRHEADYPANPAKHLPVDISF